MRSLSALALVLFLATTARAEEPPATPAPEPDRATPAPSPLRMTLVEVFETGQALVFDRVERQYLVVSVGSAIQGYRVESIMREQLELVHPDLPARHYIVTMPVGRDKSVATATPPSQPRVIPAPQPQPPAPAAPAPPAAPEPEPEPTTEPDDGDSPIDPYADAIKLPTREIKVVRAPPASRPGGEATTKPPEKPAPARPAAAPPAPPAPEPGPVTLSRKALDAALSDLDALSSDIELTLGRGGVVIESIKAGSLGYLLGLRAGDIVRSVAGIKTRKLEDGADVYVRLGQVKQFDIEITRDGKPVSLPVVIK